MPSTPSNKVPAGALIVAKSAAPKAPAPVQA
jgi:hypothetical protein